MTAYVGYRDGGKTNEEGLRRDTLQIYTDGVAVAKTLTSLEVTQRGAGANMSVDVAVGDAHIAKTDYGFWCWTDAVENVTVSASDPSNPRKDAIVAYIDLAVVDDTNNNNPGALKFKSVTGTPAGSPTIPNDSAVQTSVGAGNPWIRLAEVDVAASATQVVNANITDVRSAVSVRSGIFTVSAADIDFGGAGSGLWWEEIGRTTLGSNGDTITVASFAARKYLRLFIYLQDTGGTTNANLTFNSDSGNNYSLRSSANNASDSTVTSQGSIGLRTGAATVNNAFYTVNITNTQDEEKLLIATRVEQGTAGAGNAPDRADLFGKWANTSAQITTLSINNGAGTGDFEAGSEVIVLGHN